MQHEPTPEPRADDDPRARVAALPPPGHRDLPPSDPHGFFHPADEREVAALIHFARARGMTVRVRGAGHSVPAAIHADARLLGDHSARAAIELVLDRMCAVHFDDARRQVTVGAGCRLGRDPRDPTGRTPGTAGLCAQLDQRGWALSNLGGVAHQTVAGFLATGSAGGSLRHDLGASVVGLRLVDGRGRVHALSLADDRERLLAAGVAMGLCGVVTSVTLQCEARYDVTGDERVIAPRADDPTRYDSGGLLDAPFADGDAGLAGLFAREEYARVLWWPQRGVARFAVWRARRMRAADYDAATGPRGALRALRYAPLEPIAGSHTLAQVAAGAALGALGGWRAGLGRVLGAAGGDAAVALAEQAGARAAEAAITRAFVPVGPARPFRDSWHRALPMDDDVEDRLVPTSFTEIWVPLERTGEAMRRLRALYAAEPAAAGQFATELYAAPRSAFYLSPGHAGPALRINAFWYDRTPGDPRREFYPRLWALFADMGARLHWGKALPLDAAASARHLARQYARWDDFHRVRAELDPDGVFLTTYWRAHLGITEPPAAGVTARAPVEPAPLRRDTFLREPPARRRRWPLLFTLRHADEDLLARAEHGFEASAHSAAAPAEVSALFRAIERSGEWFTSFVHHEPRSATPQGAPGFVFDETLAFMTVRLRMLRDEAPHRWVAAVDACSLPLATRMVHAFDLEADAARGGTRLRCRVAYDIPPALRPLRPVLETTFRALFQRAIDNLARRAAEVAGTHHPRTRETGA